MGTHVRDELDWLAEGAEAISEIAEEDSQHQQHWGVGDFSFLIDLAKDGSEEQSCKDEQHYSRAIFVVLSRTVLWTFSWFGVLVSQGIHKDNI